jgi:hypothetical protein
MAMIYKLMEGAEGRWRKHTGSQLVALVRAGARFVNGKLVEERGEGRCVIKEADPQLLKISPALFANRSSEIPGRRGRNVLQEKMILVVPQPVEDAEVPTYGKLYREVTPGLSGLWQVSGRNKTTYEERVALDTYYVRNWSIWLDLVILVRTVEIFVLQAESLLRVSQKTLKVLIPAQLQFNLTHKLLSSVALSSGC